MAESGETPGRLASTRMRVVEGVGGFEPHLQLESGRLADSLEEGWGGKREHGRA